MIFILSKENDHSTNEVISWVKAKKENFIRINPSNIVKINQAEISNRSACSTLEFDKLAIKVKIDDIYSFWYRRGDLVFKKNINVKDRNTYYLETYLANELKVIEEYFHYALEKKFHINKRIDNETNKLVNLEIAKSVGLKIPPTWLVTKSNIKRTGLSSELITKGLKSSGFQIANKYSVGAHTVRVNKKKINTKFTSCIQSEIKKTFELRIFFLHDIFYSIAIFSQQSSKTSLDFRNYDRVKPNRSVPFSIPIEVKRNLKKFMNTRKLNSGSIDMIVTPKNEFYFLEVNPIGQFQQVSIPGNYYIEKKIAEKLINAKGKKRD